jgi:hypothetical protein
MFAHIPIPSQDESILHFVLGRQSTFSKAGTRLFKIYRAVGSFDQERVGAD